MNVSCNWLRSLAPALTGSPSELADRLGMLGAPVDELVDLAVGLEAVVIARVTEVRPHPNADRLRLCIVDAGGAPLQVVCGAPNVETGGFYPFVPVGATLPGGVEIRKARLRGETSEGMLCSPRELGLGRDHSGLMTLSGRWEPGTSFVRQVGLDDVRLVLDVTPNRPDLLSHLGVARELAPQGVADLRLEPFDDSSAAVEIVAGERELSGGGIQVTIHDGGDCPRYMAAIVEGIRIGQSPEWLATRLRAVGVRPINNVVDATNYVLHELGQPLHAFDLDRLGGPEIRVRRAGRGETLRTLDGIERVLDDAVLVIADARRPVALAGIMGGEESEVTEVTTRILVECALFDPRVVRQTARGLGLATDASHRFERGVDPEEQPRALRRVIDLLVAVAGGNPVAPALDLRPAPPSATRVSLRLSRVHQLLGVRMDRAEVAELLEPIGFQLEGAGEPVRVEVPAFRPDVTREVDVVEEIARRRGYDSFDAKLSHFRPGVVGTDPLVELVGSLHRLLGRWGFLEARTAAFAPAGPSRVGLLNPLSSEESHLRDELTEGLLRRVEHNWAHGVRAIRLYEIGTIFQRSESAVPGEETRIAAVFTGPSRQPHWTAPAPPWDAWDLKGLMAEVGELLGAWVEPFGGAEARSDGEPAEGFVFRSAAGERIGSGSRVPSQRLDAPAWAGDVWSFEVRLEPRGLRDVRHYQPLPSFPASDRDLALVVPPGVEAEAVEAIIRRGAGPILEEVGPFDSYAGKGIPPGARSIAWRLRFRHPDRTLTDAEIEAAVQRVLAGLATGLNVHRR
jgi:phenylalanyl-tRNA synthetase beta chain